MPFYINDSDSKSWRPAGENDSDTRTRMQTIEDESGRFNAQYDSWDDQGTAIQRGNRPGLTSSDTALWKAIDKGQALDVDEFRSNGEILQNYTPTQWGQLLALANSSRGGGPQGYLASMALSAFGAGMFGPALGEGAGSALAQGADGVMSAGAPNSLASLSGSFGNPFGVMADAGGVVSDASSIGAGSFGGYSMPPPTAIATNNPAAMLASQGGAFPFSPGQAAFGAASTLTKSTLGDNQNMADFKSADPFAAPNTAGINSQLDSGFSPIGGTQPGNPQTMDLSNSGAGNLGDFGPAGSAGTSQSFTDLLKSFGTNPASIATGLLNYISQKQKSGDLSDVFSQTAPINQVQRQPYQQQLLQLMQNPNQFFQSNPLFNAQKDQATQAFNAQYAKNGMGGTSIDAYMKNIMNAGAGTFFDQGNLLGTLGGFTQGAGNAGAGVAAANANANANSSFAPILGQVAGSQQANNLYEQAGNSLASLFGGQNPVSQATTVAS